MGGRTGGLNRLVPALSLSCVALGAFLLFGIEPLVAKAELPWFGGSPTVWCSALVFFQGVLLAGYAYSHLLLRAPPRIAAAVHIAVLAGASLLLPASLAPASVDPPVLALVRTLAVRVGLPFFALATTSTLSQAWFTRATGKEPWHLYAASNAASLAALVAYPFLIEPTLGLSEQLAWWRGGVLVWAVLLATLSISAMRSPAPPAASLALGGRELLRWSLAPAVASALLVAVSYKLAADVAAIPLLFVAPLAVYLLTFVLAFHPRVPRPGEPVEVLGMLAIVLGLNFVMIVASISLWMHVSILLLSLFVLCWIFHSDVASIRPPPERLSAFYLALSIGGFVGGLLTTLVAPLVFNDVSEFPLLLAVSAVLLARRPGGTRALIPVARRHWISFGVSVAILACAAALTHVRPEGPWKLLPLGVLAYALIRFRTPGHFVPVVVAVAVLAMSGLFVRNYRLLEARRSFFGVSRIVENDDFRLFFHGTTIHGFEDVDLPEPMPASYYHATTPMGAAVLAQKDGARIGVVGLGTGALAGHVRPGQTLTFYEIDPVVEPLARKWFRHLGTARGSMRIVLGDARLTLAAEPPASFDLLVVDAFSGDAVPVHLLTREAIAVFMERLAPGGVLQLHISNRNLLLTPVVRGIIRDAGLAGRVAKHSPAEAATKEGALATLVVALARDEASLDALPDSGWMPLDSGEDSVLWTDERSSILDVVKWIKLL